MYELIISGDFASAHFLRGYKGPCENLHGHTYKLELTIEAKELNELGLVSDFKEIKLKLNKFLEHIDHVSLNDVPFFKENNPSAENIARYIYKGFSKECLPSKLKKVRVWESDTSSAAYYE